MLNKSSPLRRRVNRSTKLATQFSSSEFLLTMCNLMIQNFDCLFLPLTTSVPRWFAFYLQMKRVVQPLMNVVACCVNMANNVVCTSGSHTEGLTDTCLRKQDAQLGTSAPSLSCYSKYFLLDEGESRHLLPVQQNILAELSVRNLVDFCLIFSTYIRFRVTAHTKYACDGVLRCYVKHIMDIAAVKI